MPNPAKIAKFGLLVTDCSFLSKINLTVLQSWKQNVGFKFSFKKLFCRAGSKMLVFSFLSRNCFAEWVTKCWLLVFFQETFSQGEEQNVRYSLLSRICFAWCCFRKNLTKVAKFFISQNLHAWFKKCVTTKKVWSKLCMTCVQLFWNITNIFLLSPMVREDVADMCKHVNC